jgi:putative membrane protein
MTDEHHSAPTPALATNRTRDHLANERTFLAWIRTALGLIGAGFVLARMGLFLRQLAITADPSRGHRIHAGREFFLTGVVFLVVGTIVAGWSGSHYHKARVAIERDRFEPADRAVSFLTMLMIVSGVFIVAFVLFEILARRA